MKIYEFMFKYNTKIKCQYYIQYELFEYFTAM